MPYTPTNWTDETPGATPIKYQIVDDTSGEVAASATIEPVTSITPGTPLNAINLNKIEQGLQAVTAGDDAAIHDNVSGEIAALTGKTVPASADLLLIEDGADNNAKKKLSVGNLLRAVGAGVYYSGAGQAIPPSTLTEIAYSAERWDTDNMHSMVTNPNRLTISTPGVYVIVGQVEFYPHPTGWRWLHILINGAVRFTQEVPTGAAGAGVFPFVNLCGLWSLNSGDYLTLAVQQTSGAELDVINAEFSAQRIG